MYVYKERRKEETWRAERGRWKFGDTRPDWVERAEVVEVRIGAGPGLSVLVAACSSTYITG
jgi:predicted nicotinamide N-methyase